MPGMKKGVPPEIQPLSGKTVVSDQFLSQQSSTPSDGDFMAQPQQIYVTAAGQPHPIHKPIQPQMTGVGHPYPSTPTQGFAAQQDFAQQPQQGFSQQPPQGFSQQLPQGFAQQPQQAPVNFAAPQFHSSTPLPNLGEGSSPADCPMCRQRSMTMTTPLVGNSTHMWAIGVCLLSGLGCIPYLITSTKDIRHNCGHCGTILATWHRSGRTVVHAFG